MDDLDPMHAHSGEGLEPRHNDYVDIQWTGCNANLSLVILRMAADLPLNPWTCH